MNREILFRGQTRKKGEKVRLDGTPIDSNWVYGGIFPNNEGGDFAIIYQQYPKIEKYTVYADTVGQYTGLTDKNGTKIFEGDIVHAVHKSNYGGLKNTDFGIGVVKYCDSYYGGASYEIDIIGKSGSRVFSASLEDGVEIIGNIHDNPKLLKQ